MARLFNGSNEYLSYAGGVVSDEPFAMAAWFYTAEESATLAMVSVAANDSYYHALSITAGAVIAYTTAKWAAGSSYSTNTWHHACGIWSANDDRRVYFDGGGEATESTSLAIGTNAKTTIGVSADTSPYGYWSGRLAEVGIWDLSNWPGATASDKADEFAGAGILSGSEGSWTHSQFVGGAGDVAAGVQRVTLANNDPAVTDLAAIEVLLTAANVDHAANEVLLTAVETLLTAANVDHAANEVLLGTIDSDTDAIKTAVETVAAAVSTQMQADIVAALPAGTSTIGGVIGKSDASVVYYGGTAYTVFRFNVVATADGDDIIGAPGASKYILLLELDVTALSATESEWYLQTTPTGTDSWGNSTNGFLMATDADGDNIAGRRWHSQFGVLLTVDANEALEVKMSSNQPMHFSDSYLKVA